MNYIQEYVQQWTYGIATARGYAGTDFLLHYEAAEAISKGEPISRLTSIASRFSFSFDTIGYFMYSLFLSVVAFMPTIFTRQISLGIVYALQSVVGIIACMNMTEYLCMFITSSGRRNKRITWWLFVSCISVFQVSNILMRDIWIFFFISVLMKQLAKERIPHFWCMMLIVLNFFLRGYTIILTIPIYGYAINRKAAIIGSAIMSFLIFSGGIILQNLVSVYNVLWDISYDINYDALLKYLLFPNILNQTRVLLSSSDLVFHGSPGSNHTLIYFILSVWNVAVLPLTLLGTARSFIKREWDNIGIWLTMSINIMMLYAILYSGISDPRHRLMILPSLVIFASSYLSKCKKSIKIFYFLGVIAVILLVIFIIAV
ncbi:MAG: hypothetical protein AB9836_01635 [Aminipila sp.]